MSMHHGWSRGPNSSWSFWNLPRQSLRYTCIHACPYMYTINEEHMDVIWSNLAYPLVTDLRASKKSMRISFSGKITLWNTRELSRYVWFSVLPLLSCSYTKDNVRNTSFSCKYCLKKNYILYTDEFINRS